MDVIQASKKTLDAAWSLANIPLAFRAALLKARFCERGKGMRAWEGRYSGETCFVLGGGPSLRKIDFSSLADKRVIGVNMLYRMDAYRALDPVFHCAIDSIMYGKFEKPFLEFIESKPKTGFLVSHNASSAIAAKPNVCITPLGYLPCKSSRAFDLSKPSLAFVNSVCFAVETALYLGFSKIVLLGCDFTQFTVRHEIHAYGEEVESTRDYPLFCDLMGHAIAIMHHEYLLAEANRRKVSIVNATEGSMLDVYPRASLAEVFGF